jgi:hypothetical protein
VGVVFAVLPALTSFAGLAAFLAVGAAFLVAAFFEVGFGDALFAPVSAVAACSVIIVAASAFFIVVSFCAVAHDDSSLWFEQEASQFEKKSFRRVRSGEKRWPQWVICVRRRRCGLCHRPIGV